MRPSRFPRAQNPLSLPFQTPATRATQKSEKKNQQNGGRISQEALRVPIPLQWGRFLRGGLISGRPANRFGMNAKLLRGVVSLISTPNDDLNTAFYDRCSKPARELQKQCPPTVLTGKAST